MCIDWVCVDERDSFVLNNPMVRVLAMHKV